MRIAFLVTYDANEMHNLHKKHIKWTLLSALALAALITLFCLAELLLYKTTGIVINPSSTEQEVQEFWDMKPPRRVSKKAQVNFKAPSKTRDLDAQISLVWSMCRKEGIRDYDGNGTVNCCDKATAFCIKWKQSYNWEVRLCQQQTDQLNHMFVQLYIPDYGWWPIEPAFTKNGSHDMQLVWGDLYNKDFNETEAYWVQVFNRYIQ